MLRRLLTIIYCVAVLALAVALAGQAATPAQAGPQGAPAAQQTAYPSPTTANQGTQATATVVTPTTSFTRTPTATGNATVTPARTATPGPATATPLLPVPGPGALLPTATPIRVPGLPVPGPGDRLPGTGVENLWLLRALFASGGLGALMFLAGRWLKRRSD